MKLAYKTHQNSADNLPSSSPNPEDEIMKALHYRHYQDSLDA